MTIIPRKAVAMRVLVCPDSFKGTLSAAEAADAIARGWHSARPGDDVARLPLADGGEGTAEALRLAIGGERVTTRVHDPLHRAVEAAWARLADGSAAIEMAAASGLLLVEESARDPGRTSTYGTGELLRAAIDSGARMIRLGIGGSATNDGGAGAMQALGMRFLDKSGNELPVPLTGGQLSRIEHIDRSPFDTRITETEILVACDVDSPLCGPDGAAAVFGPQKGADAAMVAELDAGLAHLVRVAARAGVDASLADEPGAGAAGGLGWALQAFCRAKLVSGIGMVLDSVEFDNRLANVDVVITGEGNVDAQTLRGKVVAGVLEAARRQRVPVLLVAGNLDESLDVRNVEGIGGAWSAVEVAGSREAALTNPARWLAEAAARAAREGTPDKA